MCRKMFGLLFTDGVLAKEADLTVYLTEIGELSASEVAKGLWPDLLKRAQGPTVTWEGFRDLWQTPPKSTVPPPRKPPPPSLAPPSAAPPVAVPKAPAAAPPKASSAPEWFSSEDLLAMGRVLSHGPPSAPHLAVTGSPDDWEWVTSLGEALSEVGFRVTHDDADLHDAPVFVLIYSERSERSETLLRHTTRAAEVKRNIFFHDLFLAYLISI
jgi:hypothetical protein